MKIVVFGASGGTGRELVGQAQAADHHVTAAGAGVRRVVHQRPAAPGPSPPATW
ncbi:hypothetical protein ACQEVF_20135 [Nonomuraea polychroma]|uniref:hypothetical protein n=1 Tax=Nonomuraea polychroma TaxID=46176 RepID=UPI003D89FC09